MTIDRKKRPRRIASDEAHAWARNLKLNNTIAKFILMMLAGYVDGEGTCFVSVNSLAEDTELSPQTIRSKLGWLENEVGVIARSPQYIDEYGRRNSEGKGRRTSDNIRLLIDLDLDAVEARARGDGGGGNQRAVDPQDSVDPQNVTESQVDPQASVDAQASATPHVDPHVDPHAAPHVDPQHTAEGLISEPEPEPESPPKAPLAGGVSEDSESLELQEPEHFPGFWTAYPGHEVMSRYRALEIFVTMSAAEQEHARAASPLLAASLQKLKRRPRDAHKWLADKGWKEYPQAKIAKASSAPTRRMIRGQELAVVQLALRIAGHRELSTVSTRDDSGDLKSRDSGFWALEVPTDLLALTLFADKSPDDWEFFEKGTENFASWRDRLKKWIGYDPQPERKWLEPYDPAVHSLPGSDPNFKIRQHTHGFRVPTPWPPSAEGKLYPSTTGPPPGNGSLMSEEDWASELK